MLVKKHITRLATLALLLTVAVAAALLWRHYRATRNLPTPSPRDDTAMPALVVPDGTIAVKAAGVTFTLAPVEGGTFLMGATPEQFDPWESELPVHEVTVSSFLMMQTEVTQELWQAVMGDNPSRWCPGRHRPVEYVSWDDCQAFIAKLNSLTGKRFALPTEAQWEFAARGGTRGHQYIYAGGNDATTVAWVKENSDSVTHVVATRAPNELGLYDMSGNVWEWCQDYYGAYDSLPQHNPQGPATGKVRVSRGGNWRNEAPYSRVADRHKLRPNYRGDVGLRLVLNEP